MFITITCGNCIYTGNYKEKGRANFIPKKREKTRNGSHKRIDWYCMVGISVNNTNETNSISNLIKAKNGDCSFIRINCRACDYRGGD